MQRKVAGALVVAVLSVLAGGCGENSKPLTAAQLRTQVDAVCRSTTRRIQALQAHATTRTLHAQLSRAAVVLTDGLDRLEGFEPPAALAARYRSFLAWKRTQRDAARELARPGGQMSARSRRAVEDHHSPVIALSRQLGFDACT